MASRKAAELLSNKVLTERVIALATRMRQLQAQQDEAESQESEQMWNRLRAAKSQEERNALSQQSVADELQMNRRIQAIYETTMEGEARFLRDEMLAKLPPQPKTPEAAFFDSGALAGAKPLDDNANYLESLARKLPQ